MTNDMQTLPESGAHCLNGHAVPAGQAYCGTCGKQSDGLSQPASRERQARSDWRRTCGLGAVAVALVASVGLIVSSNDRTTGPDAQAYDDYTDLRNSLIRAGYDCDDMLPPISPIGEGGQPLNALSGSCGSKINLIFYWDTAQMHQFLAYTAQRDARFESDSQTLVGPNWTVTSNARVIADLAGKLGGEVRE